MNKILIKILLIVVIVSVPLNAVYSASSQLNSGVYLNVDGTSYCGDGVVDAGEECDGTAGVPSGYTCNSSCQLVADQPIPPVQPTPDPAVPIISIIDLLKIINVYTRTGTEEIVVTWEINKDAFSNFEWGDTQDLMGGVIEKVEKSDNHRVHLPNLEPDTDYYFKINAKDSFGKKTETPIYKVRTKALVDEKAPANVDNFRADEREDSILLTWDNPKDEDFQAVKIMRSQDFYPSDISEGEEIYNDSGESYVDKDVEKGVRYYYTAFAYDNDANYSSGSVTSGKIIIPGKEEEEIEGILPIPAIPLAEPEDRIAINFDDFEFFVANKTIKIDHSDGIELLPGTILDIRTKESNYPRVLKNILVTLTPKDEKERKNAKSYLLRIDKEKEYYRTNFVAPLKIDLYNIYIQFVNFENFQVAEEESKLEVEKFGAVNILDVHSLLINSASAASEDDLNSRIYAAEITLYKYENGSFRKWNGNDFSQFNPMLSNEYGQYGFLVPNGYYFIKVRKDNYYRFESLPFWVEDNLVNQDISLIYYPQINFLKYLITLLLILFVYGIVNKFKKRKQKIEIYS